MELLKQNKLLNLLIISISCNYLLYQTHSLVSCDSIYDYDSNNNAYEDYHVIENKTKSNGVKYDYGTEVTEEENSCSIDSLLSSAKQLLPDDYEQGKNRTITTRVEHVNETMAIFRRFNQIVKNITKKLEPTMKRYASQLMTDIYTLDVSNQCLTTLMYLLSDGQFYGFRFIDSFGGIPSGLTEGTRASFGDYDQCLDIESPKDITPAFRGQYCLARVKIPTPETSKHTVNYDTYLDDSVQSMFNTLGATDTLNKAVKSALLKMEGITKFMIDFIGGYENNTILRIGMCLPSTCDPKDVEVLINKYIYPLTHMPTQLGPDCDVKGKPIVLDKYQRISLIAFLVVIGLALLSTVYEIALCRGHKPPANAKLFCSFSIIANTKTLTGPSPSLSCLDGLRVLFLFWLSFIHVYVFSLINNLVIKRYFQGGNGFSFISDPYFVLMRNLFFIDFFFMISGTLTTYIMLSKLEKSGGKFNFIQYALFRYLRMIPATVFSIFVIWLTALVMSGPVAAEVWNKFYEGCTNGWQTTLMLYQNYNSGFPEPLMCNPASWSLAAEYHMYIVAPIFFLQLYWRPRIGKILLVIVIIIACVANIVPLYFGIAHYYNWYKWRDGRDSELSIRYHFHGTNAHLSPYFIGLLFGYILRKYPSIKIGKIMEIALWIITVSMTIFSNFWCMDWFYDFPGETELQLFLVFGKPFWCAGWCWLIYACVTGRAEIINNFLSARVFKPWSRLSLGFCLMHTIPIMYRYARWRYVMPLENYYMISGSVFDYIMSYILAYFLYILVECPFGNLMQIFLMPERRVIKPKPFESNGFVINLKDECTKL